MCHTEATLMAQGVIAFLVLTTPSPQENEHWLAECLSVRRMGLDPECQVPSLLLLVSVFLLPLYSII